MKHSKTWLSALVLTIFLGGCLTIIIVNESQPTTPSTPGTDSLTPSTSDAENTYTMTQIAEHGDAASCWTAIEGNVYDLTDYIEKHPGGNKSILAICGSEGTGPFNSMPGSVMTAARLMLAKYIIGVVQD